MFLKHMNKDDSFDPKTDENLFKDLKVNEINIAWLAGLLEGEGSFQLDNRSAKRYQKSTVLLSPILKISMTDKDVIKKVANMLGKKHFQAKKKLQVKKRSIS